MFQMSLLFSCSIPVKGGILYEPLPEPTRSISHRENFWAFAGPSLNLA